MKEAPDSFLAFIESEANRLLDERDAKRYHPDFPDYDENRRAMLEIACRVLRQDSRQPIRWYLRRLWRAAVDLPIGKDNGQPPELAEFLLTLFATTRHREAMIGDLNERFMDEHQKFGRDRAVRLYWARTLRSLGPMMWRAAGKALKWGAVIDSVWRRLF